MGDDDFKSYPAFCVLSVALSHRNSMAHPSGDIMISFFGILIFPNCRFIFDLVHTFPISHQAIVTWSTLSALRHHSPDVSRPSVLSINSWGIWIIGKPFQPDDAHSQIFQPQPEHVNQQQTSRVPCYYVSGRPDNYHCHYITFGVNCQVGNSGHLIQSDRFIAF